ESRVAPIGSEVTVGGFFSLRKPAMFIVAPLLPVNTISQLPCGSSGFWFGFAGIALLMLEHPANASVSPSRIMLKNVRVTLFLAICEIHLSFLVSGPRVLQAPPSRVFLQHSFNHCFPYFVCTSRIRSIRNTAFFVPFCRPCVLPLRSSSSVGTS